MYLMSVNKFSCWTILIESNMMISMEILCRYLMSPNMQFVKFFGKNNDVDALADGIVKEIKQFKKQ